jgi:flagellar basal-body rod protein FlgG
MLNNIYTPLSGALAQERAMEAIANNLANVNTVGFKGDAVAFTLLNAEPYGNYPDPLPPANYKIDMSSVFPLKGNEMDYVGVAEIVRDHSKGPAIQTGNKLDLMIESEGYFNVQTEDGLRYARAGDLSLSPDGALVTKSGHPVLGERGLIYIRSQKFEINGKGEIYQDGQLIDRIALSQFANPEALERTGQNYFIYQGDPEDIAVVDSPQIKQGYLEGSNVNAIKNLTAMIIAHRAYEAYQKATSNYDKMMEKSSNTIGVVRA